MNVYTDRHQEQRAANDADQAELAAIALGSTLVDQGVYDDRVADALDDYETSDEAAQAGWHAADVRLDSAVGSVLEEIERRRKVLGTNYPFRLKDAQLEYSGGGTGVYEFCLAICMAPSITAGTGVKLPRTFERVSAILVRGYLGELSKSLHVGTPRDKAVGKKFSEAMATAYSRTKEFFWNPREGLPSSLDDSGDQGVDFIVWKQPADGRVGSLFVLGQCACGDDWTTKLEDVSLPRFSRWFNPISFVEPVRAFATPFHLGDGWLRDAMERAGLVFDRARLTRIAESMAKDPELARWITKMAELTRTVVGSRKAA